jgi:pimeloyl-ACP methyl ester carboxylesterase
VRPPLAGGGWAAAPDCPAGEPGTLRRPDGTDLHVETYGPPDAPVLVLTHGWSLDRGEWCYAKKELGGRFRLIGWDLPGLGRSSRPPADDYSLERMARDLDAVIGLAGGRPVVLVGHSIGGMIQLTHCRLFPEAMGERVRGIVIAQSTYTNPVRTAKGAELLAPLQRPLLEPLCHLMVWLSPVFRVINVLSYLNGSAHRSTERSSFSGRETRGQLEYLTRYYLSSSPAVVARGFLAMFRYDATDVLPQVRVPTLIVAGDRDTLCVPSASARMATAIPGARLVTLREAQHAGVFEHHAELHAEVESFASACLAERGAPAGAGMA